MANSTLPIACAINGNYALPLVVMLTALREHLRPSYEPLLFLLHQGLSQETVASIAKVVDTHAIVPGPHLKAIPSHSRFPPEAAVPLLLPELFPEGLDRVLFLDADLLVLGDLAELWEVRLDGRALGAVVDPAIPLCSSVRGGKRRADFG